MKYLLSIFPIAALAVLCLNCGNTTPKRVEKKDTVQTVRKPDTLLITAVGDMMLGSAFPAPGALPEKPEESFAAVQQHLNGDIIFGNLEGCFLDKGRSTKCPPGSTACFAFRMPESYVKVFKDAGFNVLSIANNHVGDFGDAGRRRTVELLKQNDIQFAGLTEYPYAIFEKNGIRYGFCAFAPNENTVSIKDEPGAVALVKELNKKVDILIVSFHGGGEGGRYEQITRKTEIFYNENRGNVYSFSHKVIDAGADLVLGHGPHVTRAVEVYKDRFIAYSLGNFATYGMFNLKGLNGIAPLLNIRITSKGEFLDAGVVSVKQTKLNGLEEDDSHAAFKRMADLTDMDFPGHRLLFEENTIRRLKP